MIETNPIPIQETAMAATIWKSPEPEQVQPEPRAERVAGPRPEDRRDQEERQLAAGRAADQHVQRGAEDADEHGQDERGADHVREYRPVNR